MKGKVVVAIMICIGLFLLVGQAQAWDSFKEKQFEERQRDVEERQRDVERRAYQLEQRQEERQRDVERRVYQLEQRQKGMYREPTRWGDPGTSLLPPQPTIKLGD